MGRKNFNKWVPYIRAAHNVGKAAYKGYRAYKSIKALTAPTSSSSKKAISFNPLTTQNDYQVTYRKRRMPRRKKRRYVKSIKRFNAMQMRFMPARIFQNVYAGRVIGAVNTSTFSAAFMGLYYQEEYDNSLNNAIASLGSNNVTNKMMPGSVRLDHQSLRVVLRNLTVPDAAFASSTVDIDVYQVICVRDVPSSLWPSGDSFNVFFNTLQFQHRQAQGMDIDMSSTGVAVPTLPENQSSEVGNSLFNNPGFCKYFKVLKCFKVQLAQNNVTEFQMRSSRNKKLQVREFLNQSTFSPLACKAYVTQGYIFNYNGRAWPDSGDVMNFNSYDIMEEHYVRYNLKIVPGFSPTITYDGV